MNTALPEAPERAWVDIDLAALTRNARRVASVSRARLLPMVKANGYGLGAVAVARALEPVDPWGYGVASPAEGRELRLSGIERPVLVCTPCPPSWMPAMLRDQLTPLLADLDSVRAWLSLAGERPFHVGVDTGMARGGFGLGDREETAALRQLVARAPGYEGICTHFHSADEEPQSMVRQWGDFQQVIDAVGRPPLVHAANSAASLRNSGISGDLVRPGIFLYGGAAGEQVPEPVARFRSRIVAVQDITRGQSVSYGATWRAGASTRIAVVAAGYADGWPRSGSSRSVVELRGRRVPVRGRITMDMTMVEATDDTVPDDVATIFGGLVSLDEQAALAGTISYELLTGLSPRVERRYEGAA
ncbi:MAG TPA: alanine racemase [Gemmatimonadales bacterium]|jgi:alanine racemase|nr:alanine racemase [Gemmatimonadales bacterium]